MPAAMYRLLTAQEQPVYIWTLPPSLLLSSQLLSLLLDITWLALIWKRVHKQIISPGQVLMWHVMFDQREIVEFIVQTVKINFGKIAVISNVI